MVRVGAVLLAFSGGIGIVLYLAGWLLIPLDGRNTSTLDDLRGGSAQNSAKKWPKEAWVAVVTVALRTELGHLRVGHALRFRAGWWCSLDLVLGLFKNRASQDVGRAPRIRRSPAPRESGPPDPATVPLSRSGHALHPGGRGLATANGGDRAAGRHRYCRSTAAPSQARRGSRACSPSPAPVYPCTRLRRNGARPSPTLGSPTRRWSDERAASPRHGRPCRPVHRTRSDACPGVPSRATSGRTRAADGWPGLGGCWA